MVAKRGVLIMKHEAGDLRTFVSPLTFSLHLNFSPACPIAPLTYLADSYALHTLSLSTAPYSWVISPLKISGALRSRSIFLHPLGA